MCHSITDKQIQALVLEHGVGNVRDLKQHVNLGSQCGTCISSAQDIIDMTIVDDSLFKNVG